MASQTPGSGRSWNPGTVPVEMKYVDYFVDGTSISTTWAGAEDDPATQLCLNAVTQGDGNSERQGRKYFIQSVHVRGHVTRTSALAQTGPLGDSEIVVALVLDQQTNGAQLNAEDVFLTGTNDELTFRNLENAGRYRVLRSFRTIVRGSKAFTQQAQNDFDLSEVNNRFAFNYKFKKPLVVTITDENSPTTVADILDNSLHIMAVSSFSGHTLTYQSRVRFTQG